METAVAYPNAMIPPTSTQSSIPSNDETDKLNGHQPEGEYDDDNDGMGGPYDDVEDNFPDVPEYDPYAPYADEPKQ